MVRASTAFQVRFQEWNYLDGKHKGERIFYLVAEQGKFTLAGLQGEARRLTTNKLVPAFQSINFTQTFGAIPELFTAVMTQNNIDAVTTRVDALTATGFKLAMQEQESKADGHPNEMVGWIALAEGAGLTSDKRQVQVSETTATHTPLAFTVATPFKRRYPVALMDLCSIWETDTATAAQQNLTPSSVQVYIQEEQSADAELNHAAECLSIFTAE